MTEATLDLALEERLEPSRADDADRSDSKPLLFAALRCLDEPFGTAVAHLHALLGADPFRGLQIGPEVVERWLGRAPDMPGSALPEAGLTEEKPPTDG